MRHTPRYQCLGAEPSEDISATGRSGRVQKNDNIFHKKTTIINDHPVAESYREGAEGEDEEEEENEGAGGLEAGLKEGGAGAGAGLEKDEGGGLEKVGWGRGLEKVGLGSGVERGF